MSGSHTAPSSTVRCGPLNQYELMLRRLEEFCRLNGVVAIADIEDPDPLERFKVEGLPEMKGTSKGTLVAKLRRFLKDAHWRA